MFRMSSAPTIDSKTNTVLAFPVVIRQLSTRTRRLPSSAGYKGSLKVTKVECVRSKPWSAGAAMTAKSTARSADSREAVSRTEGWLLHRGIQIDEDAQRGGVAGWLDRDGRPVSIAPPASSPHADFFAARSGRETR
jgi:hypothetical protein